MCVGKKRKCYGIKNCPSSKIFSNSYNNYLPVIGKNDRCKIDDLKK